METKIEFTRINNDVNDKPRGVCHFLNFITDNDNTGSILGIGGSYDVALSRAKKIGGRKFHNKQYGCGIVFQSYNLDDTAKQIVELKNK